MGLYLAGDETMNKRNVIFMMMLGVSVCSFASNQYVVESTQVPHDGSLVAPNNAEDPKLAPGAIEQQPTIDAGAEDGSGDDADTLHDPDPEDGAPDVGTPIVRGS